MGVSEVGSVAKLRRIAQLGHGANQFGRGLDSRLDQYREAIPHPPSTGVSSRPMSTFTHARGGNQSLQFRCSTAFIEQPKWTKKRRQSAEFRTTLPRGCLFATGLQGIFN